MSDNHDHDNGQQDAHPGVQPDIRLGERARRGLAMQELLIEKGLVKREEVQRALQASRERSYSNGAKVVARAWVDPAYKERLLANPIAAVEELGFEMPHDTPRLAVVENTENVHYLIVCTLCSCYPGMLLGNPPDWYKSLPYRSRAVKDPRGVIREFGHEVDNSVEVRVVDSTADLRYMVLPMRPAGTDGMTEDELARLVTRDSMIGVNIPLTPEMAASGAD
jgi:nitrile hydratase